MSDILERAKAASGSTYYVLLLVNGVAETMKANEAHELKVATRIGGEALTLEIKR